ncbi:MAG TPA: glycosyltransferase [Lysobacter sp.]|nr:glycosyltransferase [Lysobacter sp.]
MRMSWADLRYAIDRSTGLIHRGLASLRTRGVRDTWQRVRRQFQRVPVSQRLPLYAPEPAPFAPFALPCSAQPRASVVIPVFNQFAHTLTCLRALAAHPPALPVEIIVVDDGSSDDTERCLAQVDGLRYHRRATNGGFIAACNDGAAHARGEYLVFLNNDTVPQPGWLDALLDTFDTHPGTGLVGAQLLDPDGRLQESGAGVRRDGDAYQFGRGESPLHPLHAHVRAVDYCSGAAIALPRALFEAVGGFDPRYAPAYYEDTDLAFAVRARGLEVLRQPAARVVHVEGATAGRDVRRGAKQRQVVNRATFAAKWRTTLGAHAPAQERPTRGGAAPCLLVIDAWLPESDRDSASLRLENLLRVAVEEGAHVCLLPTDGAYRPGAVERLQRIGVETWHRPFQPRIAAWLREHGPRFDTVMVCRHHVLRELLPLLRRYAPQARVVFDTVDLHYLRERRGAELAGDAALLRLAERTRAQELALVAAADVTLVVSEVERTVLAQDAPGATVEVLSNVHRVHGPGQSFDARRDLVFVGGFRHPPNVDAVRWFAAEVFPRIRAQAPELLFHVIGAEPPEDIAALAREPGIRVHGHVAELAPYMDGARVAVAPLRYGAGVKGKVNLSMAHGQPVVATACAVEGMHLRDGEDVLIADDPDAFAAAVLRLYGDRALWERLARNGLANVQRHFSLDAARAVVRRVLLQRAATDRY